jgi:predicted ATPase
VDSRHQAERIAAIQTSVRDYLVGIEATAKVFPLGALHLAASLIDALARLTFERARGGDAAQCEQFVREYFPIGYHADDLPGSFTRGFGLLACTTSRLGAGSR